MKEGIKKEDLFKGESIDVLSKIAEVLNGFANVYDKAIIKDDHGLITPRDTKVQSILDESLESFLSTLKEIIIKEVIK